MNDTTVEEQAPVVVRVLRDLRAIERLCADTEHPTVEVPLGAPEPRPRGFVGPMPEAFRRVRVTSSRLLTEAVHAGGDPDMPGGAAMVALATVGNAETWGYKLDTAEELAEARGWRTGEPTQHVEVYDDDEGEPPLQTLVFWSSQWRTAHDMDSEQVEIGPGRYADRKPTIGSEVSFLRWAVDWAHHELDAKVFARFARDVADARTRAENLLRDGVRSERGVPCMYDGCKGKRLVRKMVPGRDEDGNKVWYYSPWHCPSCHLEWDEDAYARMVTAANEAAKIEDIPIVTGDEDRETWCSTEYAARRTGRPAATIRVWAHRGRIPTLCLIAGRRRGFVRLTDVDEQHALAERRARAHKTRDSAVEE